MRFPVPLLSRACRALFVPVLLSLALVAVVRSVDPMPLEWRVPSLVREAHAAPEAEPVVEAAAVAEEAAAEEAVEAPPGPQTTCTPSPDTPVPDMVGAIFRCRLIEAGFSEEQVRVTTAEAIAVAYCESEFDPNAVVFGGRYRDVPHPLTGSRYSATGIFQFIRDRADRWIEGGYANATDPAANIDAAARMYLHNVRRGFPGWSDWACAAANDGFRATSVLPGWPGGPPSLPGWVWNH
ncbi:MAG TPA: transglycosylase SLT domain-containing protein [Acidimicrobiales bacterium]|jgi:hypothetical protein|nr:transglycosylase SLT domain-containing protein [Acidimicrobiales bacterium]